MQKVWPVKFQVNMSKVTRHHCRGDKCHHCKGDMWHDHTGHLVIMWKHPKVPCGTPYVDWEGDKAYRIVTWPYRWTNHLSTHGKDRPMRGYNMVAVSKFMPEGN
jgi:hypothetical protein